mgnify:CR=1 FL=1
MHRKDVVNKNEVVHKSGATESVCRANMIIQTKTQRFAPGNVDGEMVHHVRALGDQAGVPVQRKAKQDQ